MFLNKTHVARWKLMYSSIQIVLTYDKEVNNIAECNLLDDVINPPKRDKQFKYPILPYSTRMYEY